MQKEAELKHGFILLKMKAYLSSHIILQVCKVSSVIGCFSCSVCKAIVQGMKLQNKCVHHVTFLHKEGDTLGAIVEELTMGSASSHSYPPASHVGICRHKQHAASHVSCKPPALMYCSRFWGGRGRNLASMYFWASVRPYTELNPWPRPPFCGLVACA